MEALSGAVVQQGLNLEQQEMLYERYHKNVYHTVYHLCRDRELAEELTNEAYLVAFQKIYMLKDMDKFKGWICSIALNLARDYIRKNHRISPVASVEQWIQSCYTVEDEVVAKLDLNQVKAAINGLDSHYRNVIILRYYHDLPYNDIAKRLNLSCGTVKTRINRAKGKLHHLLGKKDGKQELPALSAM
ncbi:RNA polymerase sigma-70 factor (ECF subfamily) [Anaerosolibacter carboniphilus]|uniref:RNA polymerase sigma-70 factor (ECF subfamily) n=1 Tax=Anaerosolibacter carboniphilus TaxID=1417629 RepID=A0A841KJC2_9FIRM|nr:sigma-70 family RNA polymerase sigma factor [Anaerosolibacter carboniphilus]MBB6213974.1 RNA polymerase sigma-70 factor (ECF subfamily) [Anaerosolibacter carboniphilus]